MIFASAKRFHKNQKKKITTYEKWRKKNPAECVISQRLILQFVNIKMENITPQDFVLFNVIASLKKSKKKMNKEKKNLFREKAKEKQVKESKVGGAFHLKSKESPIDTMQEVAKLAD